MTSLIVIVLAWLSCAGAIARTYTTDFPLSENPISEGGNWIGGKTVGLDWADCATTNLNGRCYVFNLQPPFDGFDYPDATALLTGNWGPTQSVSARIHCTNQLNGSVYEEVELRLRSSLSNHWGTGYLINWSLRTDSSTYVQMGRWDGSMSDFSPLSGSEGGVYGLQYVLHDGDTVSATITNNTVRAFINGVLVLQGTDTTGSPWTNGSPGLGFWMSGTTNNTDYGYTSFTATDGIDPPLTLVSPLVTNGQFSFSFQTELGQSYFILQFTNLVTSDQGTYTRITGTGLPYRFSVPVTKTQPSSFFRVMAP